MSTSPSHIFTYFLFPFRTHTHHTTTSSVYRLVVCVHTCIIDKKLKRKTSFLTHIIIENQEVYVYLPIYLRKLTENHIYSFSTFKIYGMLNRKINLIFFRTYFSRYISKFSVGKSTSIPYVVPNTQHIQIIMFSSTFSILGNKTLFSVGAIYNRIYLLQQISCKIVMCKIVFPQFPLRAKITCGFVV
jgi:hypothetical protein